MTLVMVIFESVARAGRAVLGAVSWRAMPLAVRVLFAVLFGFVVVVAIHERDPVAGRAGRRYTRSSTTACSSARRCCASPAVRSAAASGSPGRSSAYPSALWATGNLYWQFALSDLAEAPYPSVADGFWLGFLPVCYVGVLLLARKRMPQLDSRLWLDGIIAALTTGAISAAVIFGAVHASTGGDTAAVATNLAYPLGDMILLGTVIGAMAAGRGRLDRSWLYFGAGIAVFAVTDSIYLAPDRQGHLRRSARCSTSAGSLGTLLVGLAAWQPAVRKRATGDELPSIVTPIGLALASLALLVYDHFERINLLALGLCTAALVAALVRLSLTHRASRANLVSTRVQARTDSLTGLGNRFALQRALDDALAEPVPHVLLMLDLDGFKNYNDSYGHPAGDALLARLGSRLLAAADRRRRRGVPHRRRRVLRARRVAGRPAARSRWSSAPARRCPSRAKASRSARPPATPRCPATPKTPKRRCAWPTAASTPRRTAGASRPASRARARCAARCNEANPELGGHTDEVATLATEVARRLDLDEDEIERVVIAAELTTSARSPSPARSCASPARSTPTSGPSCGATP